MSSMNGEVIVADQRIGGALQLRVYGDEFYARRETLSGYTVIYDTQKNTYCYATLAAGRFISTGIPVGKPAPSGLRKHLKEDPAVRNEKFSARYSYIRVPEVDANTGEMRTLGPDGGLLSGRKLHSGQVIGLTILVNFDDIRSSITADDVAAMFNSDAYSENGNYCSVKSYFEEVSSGKLTYNNIIVGPIQLSKRRSHYISTLLVEEAMNIVVNDLQVDLNQFDSKGEGVIDAINFLYAGESQYDGNLWPHNSVATLQYGSMRTHYYQLTGLGLHTIDLRIGTICHENGHLLCRFPDMYDYGKRDGDHEKSQGIGRYCLMGSGNHLNNRRTPAPVCGYLRELAGWVDTVVDLAVPGAYAADHGKYDTVMKYSTEKPNEYFLVENRMRMGLDSFLPSSGLAVLHCDTLGSNEWQDGTRNNHYQCAILQADGHLDLENNRNAGDDGDLFKGVNGLVLSDTTTPSSREWDGTDSGLLIRDVSSPDQTINFIVGDEVHPGEVRAETWPAMVIPDNDENGISSTVSIVETGLIRKLTVSVEIYHGWKSDLAVVLHSPSGVSVTLHDHQGSDGDDIVETWSNDVMVALQQLEGESVQGMWTLSVMDTASSDVGRLAYWSIVAEIDPLESEFIEKTLQPTLDIPDDDSAGATSILSFDHGTTVKDITLSVDIEHGYIGDLQVDLVSPSGRTVRVHNQDGAWQQNLQRSYDSATVPALQDFIGETITGDWQLRLRDLAPADQGKLNSWSLKIWH